MDTPRLLRRLLDAHDLLREPRSQAFLAQAVLDLVSEAAGIPFGCVVLCPDPDSPFQLLALNGATWNNATGAFFHANSRSVADLQRDRGLVGLTFAHQSGLVMAPPAQTGLPMRQPPPTAMIGLPFQATPTLSGVIALAGRPTEDPAELLDLLQPAAETLGRLLAAPAPASSPTATRAANAPRQDALEEALSRGDAIIRTMPDAVISIGVDGLIRSANPATERIFGYPPDELLGQPISLLLPASDHDVPDEMATGDARFFGSEHSLTGRRHDGSLFPMEITIARGRFDGRPIFIWIARDITALRQAEMEREKFFNITPELLCIATYDGYFLRVNDAWSHTLGYTAAELTTVPYIDFVHPSDRPGTVAESTHIIRTAFTDRFENRYRHKDGSYRWLQWVAVGLPDENRIFAAARDITGQRRLEAQIETTNEALRRYSAGLKRLHQISARKHDDYHALVSDYLAAGCSFFTMTTGIVSHIDGVTSITEAVHADANSIPVGSRRLLANTLCAEVVRERRTLAYASPEAFPPNARAAVGVPPASWISAPIWLDQAIYGTLSFSSTTPRSQPFHDFELEIIELMAESIGRFLAYHHAERDKQQAARERERLVEILEASPDLVAMFEPRGDLLFLNKAGRRLLGLPQRGPLHGLRFDQHLAPDALDDFHNDALPHATAHGVHTAESTVLSHDDGPVPVAQVLVAHRDGDGLLTHFSVVQHDIRVLKEVDRLKNEFVSTVSHELRTPLTSLRGSLGLLTAGIMGPLPDNVLELLNIAQNNAERLIRLINDILDLEKIASGKMEFDFEELDLAELLQTTARELHGAAFDAHVQLDNRIDAPLRIIADRDRIQQVFTNLIGNAIKFSPPGTTVHLDAHYRPGGLVRVEVADEGPGVPTESRDRIFDKFQQGDGTDARKKGGTGLGLTICKAIVDGHDGTIGVIDNPPRGARFFVEFASTRPTEHLTAVARSGELILIVEDDAGLCDVLWEMLQSEHHHLATARTLKAARTLLASQRPALILLDVELPDGNGLHLLDDLPPTHTPHVIVLSSHDRSPERHHPAIDDWIVKPFTLDQLLEHIHRFLAEAPAPPDRNTP